MAHNNESLTLVVLPQKQNISDLVPAKRSKKLSMILAENNIQPLQDLSKQSLGEDCPLQGLKTQKIEFRGGGANPLRLDLMKTLLHTDFLHLQYFDGSQYHELYLSDKQHKFFREYLQCMERLEDDIDCGQFCGHMNQCELVENDFLMHDSLEYIPNIIQNYNTLKPSDTVMLCSNEEEPEQGHRLFDYHFMIYTGYGMFLSKMAYSPKFTVSHIDDLIDIYKNTTQNPTKAYLCTGIQ